MKIFIISNGYPTKLSPQFGCFEKDQALALKRAGHDVSILYIDGRFRFYWRKLGVSHKVENDINIYGIYWFPIKFLRIAGIKVIHRLRNYMLERVFKHVIKMEGKPDIIYAHYLYNIVNATNLKEKYDIPLVGIEHWSMLNQSHLSSKTYYSGNIAYPKSDRILAVSNTLAKNIQKNFRINAIVVHNMLGCEFLNHQNVNKTKESNSFKFVAIGSLLPVKGFDILVNAFNKAKLREKNCRLVIIGEGKEKNKLQQQINSLSLSNYISLVGRKTKQEIISILDGSDAFVLSSHSETFSVVCIEAMALGLPVVATRCGGPEEFITNEIGQLVQSGDVDALAEGMNDMYNNYDMYNRNNIRKICIRKFAPEVIAQQLTSIFDEVVSK